MSQKLYPDDAYDDEFSEDYEAGTDEDREVNAKLVQELKELSISEDHNNSSSVESKSFSNPFDSPSMLTRPSSSTPSSMKTLSSVETPRGVTHSELASLGMISKSPGGKKLEGLITGMRMVVMDDGYKMLDPPSNFKCRVQVPFQVPFSESKYTNLTSDVALQTAFDFELKGKFGDSPPSNFWFVFSNAMLQLEPSDQQYITGYERGYLMMLVFHYHNQLDVIENLIDRLTNEASKMTDLVSKKATEKRIVDLTEEFKGAIEKRKKFGTILLANDPPPVRKAGDGPIAGPHPVLEFLSDGCYSPICTRLKKQDLEAFNCGDFNISPRYKSVSEELKGDIVREVSGVSPVKGDSQKMSGKAKATLHSAIESMRTSSKHYHPISYTMNRLQRLISNENADFDGLSEVILDAVQNFGSAFENPVTTHIAKEMATLTSKVNEYATTAQSSNDSLKGSVDLIQNLANTMSKELQVKIEDKKYPTPQTTATVEVDGEMAAAKRNINAHVLMSQAPNRLINFCAKTPQAKKFFANLKDIGQDADLLASKFIQKYKEKYDKPEFD